MATIQPGILTWARETAGLSLDEAARVPGLNTVRGSTGAERLAALEAGAQELPRTVLLKMTKAYHRPLLTFYLAEPPPNGDRGQDFRTLPGHDPYHPEVDALVRDIKARQGIIRSLLEDDEAAPVDFIGAARTTAPFGELAERITGRLGFSSLEFRAAKNPDQAFAYLRGRIEASGVFVMLPGNLGSHHTNIPVESFRGFALADPVAPLIVINDQDAPAARSFTALHELAHLWLGATGISGGTDADNAIERYCNDVAGQVLLPTSEVMYEVGRLAVDTFEDLVGQITGLAVQFRVSRAMVAYKLLRIDNINHDTWAEVNAHLSKEWAQLKQREAEKKKEGDGGPNYYVVRRHRVGPAVLGLVRRSLDDGTITYTKASRVLGVKPRNVEPLLSPVRGGR